jgi:fermentation-respiration switch protein FrsA (DUF1100 family)
VIDDALAAAELLRQQADIDPQRIFILGHSLGGMLLPRMALAEPRLAGLIVLAGPSRPLEDLMLEQMQYLATLSGTPAAQTSQQLDEIRKQVALIKSSQLTASTPAALALGVPGAYWLDLRGYKPAEVARTLDQPLLILQGGRDYQVTAADYAGWVEALAGKTQVSVKLYPDLNHLFLAGSGISTPAEYNTPGAFSQAVIDDISVWITEH